jgi:hypothetical protein|eukprot:scaffold666_cov272-Chaetoceros_neogracile.AAC.31
MDETTDYQIDTNDLLATDDVASILSQDILDSDKEKKEHEELIHQEQHDDHHLHHHAHPQSQEHYRSMILGHGDDHGHIDMKNDIDHSSILTSNISAEVVSAAAAAAAAYGGLLSEPEDIVQPHDLAHLTSVVDDDGQSFLDVGMSHEEHLASRRQKDRERYASMSHEQREVYNCKRREQYHRQSEGSRKKRRERERVRYHSLVPVKAKERNVRRATLERDRYKKLSLDELASRNSKRRARAASLRAQKKANVAAAQAQRQALAGVQVQHSVLADAPVPVGMQQQAPMEMPSMHPGNGVPMPSVHMDPVTMASLSVDVADMNHLDLRGPHMHVSMGNMGSNMGDDEHFKHEV